MRRILFLMTVLVSPSVQAGLYDPASPSPFRFVDGKVQPLEFGAGNSGEFALRYTSLLNLADENPRRKNEDRAALLKKLESFKVEGATPAQIAGHAVDLIRVNRAEKAISLLQPLSRGRTASFAVLMNLAHAYAVTGDWNAALRTHDIALDADPARDLPNWSPELRSWLIGIEKKQYRAWLRWNFNNPKPNPETQTPLPLFEKLSDDDLAITQQLLLWQPGDSNLYWLLAERYLAVNQLRQAATIFNQLADSRQYSNRKQLMATRAYVLDAVAKLPPEVMAEPHVNIAPTPTPPKDEWDDEVLPRRNLLFAIAIFGPLAVLLIGLQLLRLRKRRT